MKQNMTHGLIEIIMTYEHILSNLKRDFGKK